MLVRTALRCGQLYVADRDDLFRDIVRWYGLPGDDFAKTAILVVSNNGALKYWRRKITSMRPRKLLVI